MLEVALLHAPSLVAVGPLQLQMFHIDLENPPDHCLQVPFLQYFLKTSLINQ